MRLSTKGRYAVMAMVDLALYNQDQPVSLAEIAERQEISLSYLEQLFAKLRQAGLVSSVRGPGGGYKMARSPADIAVYDVFAAVNEPLSVNSCNPESPHGCRADKSKCMTHDLWLALSQSLSSFLSSISIEDVMLQRVDVMALDDVVPKTLAEK